MEIKGIDVSAWQGKIDWKKVADYGMGFAILRITEAGNIVDKYFEANLTGCNKHKIPVGVYKYSYAKSSSRYSSIWNITTSEHSEQRVSTKWLMLSGRSLKQQGTSLQSTVM